MYYSLLIILSIAEFALFFLLMFFFIRLRKNEELLTRLRHGQDSLLDKLHANARLEHELMASFTSRQQELVELSTSIDHKVTELKALLAQAEAVSRSPQFLRELILDGTKKGRTPKQLTKSTGLSLDEITLILEQTSFHSA